MSKRKTHTRPTPIRTATSRNKKSKFNDAKETRQFFTILLVGTLLLVFFLYLIFMKAAR